MTATSVATETAERLRQVIADLEQQRHAATAAVGAFAERRRQLALHVYLGAKGAGKELAGVRAQLAAAEATRDDLDDALAQAELDLHRAEDAERLACDAGRAGELRDLAARVVMIGKKVDVALTQLARHIDELRAARAGLDAYGDLHHKASSTVHAPFALTSAVAHAGRSLVEALDLAPVGRGSLESFERENWAHWLSPTSE